MDHDGLISIYSSYFRLQSSHVSTSVFVSVEVQLQEENTKLTMSRTK
jgi:hypothetical protein